MEDLFNQTQNQEQNQIHHQLAEQHTENLNNNQQPPITYITTESNDPRQNNDTSPQKPPANDKENQNDFDEFEQDEVTKKIRQEQQRIQNLLAQKSQRQWEQKQKRRQQGKKQLQEFNSKKEQEKEQRTAENTRKEATNKDTYAKINQEAGWKKVISSISLRQGEHKGLRDISRMREAIQHKRQDDNS